MNKMCTFTGKSFDYENVGPQDICIEDIAHALGHICRYAGQCNKFYSVAEHCVLLSRAKDMPGTPLARLLHDATEAYVADIVRPLKNLLLDYKLIEHDISMVVSEKYGVDFSPVEPGDTKMIGIEAAVLMHDNFFEIHNESNPNAQLVPHHDPEIEIMGWSPEVASFEFITRAATLGVTE